MSYAITVTGLPPAQPEFESQLRAILSHGHEAKREEERQYVRRVRYDSMVGQGKAPQGLAETYRDAVRAAKAMGNKYLEAEALASASVEAHEHAKSSGVAPEILAGHASEVARTEGLRLAAQKAYQPLEDAAEEAKRELYGCVPDEALAHVGPLFDAQIEGGIRAAVALLPGVGSSAKSVRVQLGGHCEQTAAEGGLCSVHVWPE